ncbi:hypothetical protein F4780DRAFT_795163 [Xylariomycetidae sp. FL0641]|nr:hypothetical protein F4780DRAFT_795163 [Xylariomycetidae sp. FL0641]
MDRSVPAVESGVQVPDDIAVVGYSFKLPQDVNDDNGFWEVLEGRRNLKTGWPESRLNTEAFVNNKNVKFNGKGGHFINEDVGAFDAPFFSVTPKEAAAMDPVQRWSLETSYRAVENAGIPAESLRGSRTAVFSASMLEDYARMTAMDPDNAERTAVTGSTVACVIPNRISWYFDLRGPSIHVNTACSSSLTAVDMACKTLRSGDATCALVTGSNLLLDPGVFQVLSTGGFLSPDSVCHSFDHRANGYARGEGIIVLVLKPVAAAVRDGDMIRAVIRATGSNQDGQTPVLTQPSPQAQEELIRHVYKSANLALGLTRYVEAHGTGTPVGDPIETKAIGRVFRRYRSDDEPLYVGSVKANLGHLEGASALAALVKCILTLEKGVIPPNALLEKLNPAIDAEFYHITVPTENIPWPQSGLRRVSLNSFGFGGSNTHIVLDDALHYMQDRGLTGNHCTTLLGSSAPAAGVAHVNGHSHTNGISHANGRVHINGSVHTNGTNGTSKTSDLAHTNGSALTNGSAHTNGVNGTSPQALNLELPTNLPKLLVWSAADEKAVKRTLAGYEDFFRGSVSGDPGKLANLAYTLASRRSRMLWRTYAQVLDGPAGALQAAKPTRSAAPQQCGIAFVFTGQGAQYADMGWELVGYRAFRSTLQQIDDIYARLGCPWSLFDALRCKDTIHEPQRSQPLATAVQLALVELLRSFGIAPRAVVGHSSGEIAAAYAAGALDLASACKVSYFRGQLAGQLKAAHAEAPGAMMSVNLAEDQVAGYVAKAGVQDITVACVNSPTNCTLSGPEAAIDAVKVHAGKDGIFAAKLKTGVAYHSPQMLAIAEEYLTLMGELDGPAASQSAKKSSAQIPMVSSVTGKPIRAPELAKAQYWVDNMVSPVRFADAVQMLTQQSAKLRYGMGAISDLVEIGPHPALRRPVLDTIKQAGNRKTDFRYASALHRSQPAAQTTLELVGQLFCHGHPVAVDAVNEHSSGGGKPAFLVDCPQYPFDHSNTYWAESRLSRDYRLRGSVKGETLGVRASDWNALEPRWRNFLCVDSMPWLGHHVISDTVVFPAAGMLIMALEAAQQMVSGDEKRALAGFHVKRADFVSPIIVKEAWEDRVETQVRLRPQGKGEEAAASWLDVSLFAYLRGQWTECFSATVRLDYTGDDDDDERRLSHEKLRVHYEKTADSCTWPVDSSFLYTNAAEHGLQYGDWFQVAQDVRWDGKASAVARVDVSKARLQTTSLAHPAVLDSLCHVLRVSAGQQPAANVPIRLHDGWFKASGWQTGSLRWLSTSTARANGAEEAGHGEQGRLWALADDGSVLCTIGKMVTAAVTKDTKSKEKKLLYRVEWAPQMSLLAPDQLAQCTGAHEFKRDEEEILALHAKLSATLDLAAARTLKGVDRAKVPGYLNRHVDWMEHHTSKMSAERKRDAETIGEAEVEDRFRAVEEVLPAWTLYTECARKLPAILDGELDPLSVVFESDLADVFYADLFKNLCGDGRLRALLDLLSHENPALRVFEVGAGTGGMTGHVLSLLRQREGQTGAPSFANYTYTDISPAFFEKAKSRWPELEDRMTFKTFDMDRSLESQGFEPASYDVVVAASVLHATPDLEAAIRNVRKALKPGGRLVLLEVINPDDIATNFMAGLVPGWWVAREEWRPHSAAVPETLWHRVLSDNGFSGNDMVIRDYQHDECHIMSIIVSKALEVSSEPSTPALQPSRLVIVTDSDHAEKQQPLVDAVRSQVDPKNERQVDVCPFSLDELTKALSDLSPDDVVISLVEVNNKPLFTSLSEADLDCLKQLLAQTSQLLWATASSPHDSQAPDYGAMQGFFRSIRAEQGGSRIVTVGIEGAADAGPTAGYIGQIFGAAFGPAPSGELEYVVRDGLIQTARAVEDVAGNRALRALLSPQRQERAWGEGPALRLSMAARGSLDSLRFVRDAVHATADLAPEEVEVETRAWGLGHRDLQVALGRLDQDRDPEALGGDCAGVVTRVGSACDPPQGVRPGDRVCLAAPGCMRRYARAPRAAVCKLPGELSFERAAAVATPGMAAYHGLVEAGRLGAGDRVLVHCAASSVGQLAVQVARWRGAEVFATASTPAKRRFVAAALGVPADHVFGCRGGAAFAPGVLRASRGEGVDVVFNLLPGEDALRASAACLAPHGRFVEVSRANIEAGVSLPMDVFAKNITFAAVDVMTLKPRTTAALLKNVMHLQIEGKIAPPQQLHVFNASEIEKAFRQVQAGELIGRVVISPKAEDVVPQFIQDERPWTFDENASYLIAGGSGGLGRAIMKWMADRGAKHLIVPSRSGASSKAATQLVAELTARGVQVVAPRCDVSDAESLSKMLGECQKTMPAIKGCINGAMVLQDAVFPNMSQAQWELTMRSKAATSWNLHQQLPAGLDFFVLLASLAGVVGQMASANYAAGCTFQDALARHRVAAEGQRATSLDIGWMRNVGIIAETGAYQRQRLATEDMQPVDDVDLLAVLTLLCDPARPQDPDPQVLFGLRTPADSLALGQTPSALLDRPLFAAYAFLAGAGTATTGGDAGTSADQGAAARFRDAAAADDPGARAQVVLRALAAKLARAMSIAPDDVEAGRPLSAYGVDSLMAVELRNWIGREFAAPVAVFDIMGGVPIAGIADLVVARSTLGREAS